jgi:hypothetical protein
MSDDHHQPSRLNRLQQYRFVAMMAVAIAISLFLVGVSLALYNSSGAAQLDLSRPGYQSVRDQVVSTDSFDSFPASGPIDRDVLDQFRKLYDEQSKQATGVDAFGGDVMTDKALSIDAPE